LLLDLAKGRDGSIVGKCRCPSRAPAVCSLLHKRQLSCQQRRVQQPNAKDPSEASRASIEAAKQPSVNSAFFDEKEDVPFIFGWTDRDDRDCFLFLRLKAT